MTPASGEEAMRRDEVDGFSREHAARMLADGNYPTAFERGALLLAQPQVYQWRQVSNLLAMLDEARARITQVEELQAELVEVKADRDLAVNLANEQAVENRKVEASLVRKLADQRAEVERLRETLGVAKEGVRLYFIDPLNVDASWWYSLRAALARAALHDEKEAG